MKYQSVMIGAFAVSAAMNANAGAEGMKEMPLIQPKKTITVQSKEAGEDLNDQRGFGDQEPSVRMMNLMMVEGSGFEGMDMGAMPKAQGTEGMDHRHGMNMAANDEAHDQTQPAAAKESAFEYAVDVKPNPPRVGSNTVTISVTTAKTGKPAQNLKPKAQVYMTSMDMGRDEPRVREIAPGKYQIKAMFSMKGSWAVELITSEEKVVPLDVVGK